jgi:hypothetical protein
MGDFRAFTLAASVTTIVLGAGIGAALGAISGPQPPPVSRPHAPASTAGARADSERHGHASGLPPALTPPTCTWAPARTRAR